MPEHETPAPEELTDEELAAQDAEPLPERAAMSVVHGPDVVPLPGPIDEIGLPVEPPESA